MAKKNAAEIAEEKKQNEIAVKLAEKAFDECDVKEPEDLQKSISLLKSVYDLKGKGIIANVKEKMAALEETFQKSIDAKDTEIAELKSDAIIDRKSIDRVNTMVKKDRLNVSAGEAETKSFGALLSEGLDEVKEGIADLARSKGPKVSFTMKAVADMTFGVNFPSAAAAVTYVKPGIIELPKRKLHIRELLTGGSMGAKSTFDFVKEVAGDGNISTVAEGVLKPQIDLKLVEASVKAQWIAGWLRISRNMLDDVTGMTTFLQSRLPELLLRAEDAQILNGNGTSPNLSGILNPGNFTEYNGAATIDVEQLILAVAQLEVYDREANGILLNPADWYSIWLNKASGSGEYDLPNNLITKVGNLMYIAGIPVFRSTALQQDTFIVGDWVMGANFINREPMRVEFFYEDGINVRENMITVRVEERVALPIYGNNYFIKGDFGRTAS